VAWLGLLALPERAGAQPYEVEVIQQSGPSANRVDIAILGDGYRVQDQAKLTSDVQAFLARFWQYTPYGEYRNFFNIKLVHVISNENGADNGSYGAVRDTALGAYFNCYNIDRLLCVNNAVVYSVAGSHVPEWDSIFVIVNDPKYGGAGGSISTFSVHASAGDIAVHEYGHSHGGLADEYEDAYPGYPGCGSDCPEPNATTRTQREQVKWNPWIEPTTPVPTPETSTYQTVIGVFEGARYQSSGVYRPRQNCCMRSLAVPFCAVCREALVLATYRRVSPVDALEPASPVSLGACASQAFSVAYPAPVPDTLEFVWRLDGQVVETGGAGYTLNTAGLATGPHSLSVEVVDLTALVRNDPTGLLNEERAWTLQISGAPVCLVGGTCYPEGAPDPVNPCRACRTDQSTTGFSPDDAGDCQDGQFCNGAEQCAGGACQPGPPPCQDDGLACTATCDEGSRTCNVLQPGFCLIDARCVPAGQAEPGNPCRGCRPDVDPSAWTPLDGAGCDDGLFCNGPETCQAGACQAGEPPCQDDGLACTSLCDETARVCNAPLPGFCLIDARCVPAGQAEPGNPCRSCQPGQAARAWSPDDAGGCDDGLFCNGPETCQAGACQASAPPCQDDGLACTSLCDETARTCNAPLPGFCLIDARCVPAGQAEPGNPCRSCQPGQAARAWSPDDTAACDDGDACTVGEGCSAGACRSGERLCNQACPCETEVQGGCGCGAGGPGGSPAGALLLLGLLALGRRRLS
jgi:uncharacterized protein (TIGR03382 family)